MADGSGVGVAYPAHWEADVVLADGSATHVRPIRPTDADALQAFHVAQSERSTYMRFFMPLERLPDKDLTHLVTVDGVDRVAFVAVSGTGADERIIGVGRYDRLDETAAEVAFNISDAHQGKGLGSVLLEHLAAAARERGVRRFVAEVLPSNGRMLAVFRDAGYAVRQRTEDGVVSVAFDIDPTDRSLEVMADREHRAEARSMRALLAARSVLVVGPRPDDPRFALHSAMVERVVGHLVAGERAVAVIGGPRPEGVRGFDETREADEDVDLLVLACEPDRVLAAVRDLAGRDVRGLVLLSAGFAEAGPEGLAKQRRLLRAAHGAGMRIVGPGSYGLVATGPAGLDVSLSTTPLTPGRLGLFCQSAPMAVTLRAEVQARGLGVSQFVSSGHRADVSGNDLMQFWGDDERTDVVALYLESVGNPRKFSRVARRLAAHKPVVVLTAGRSGQVVPPGHAVRRTQSPRRTLEEMLRQSGVLRVDSTRQLVDVAALLVHQPLPAGPRTAILASSASAAALATEAAAAAGLQLVRDAVLLPEDTDPDQVPGRLTEVFEADDVDAVLVVRIPVLGGDDSVVERAVAAAAARTGRTTLACLTGRSGVLPELTATDPEGRARTVPAYAAPEDAAAALGAAVRYAAWRARDHGQRVRPAGVDTRAARRFVEQRLAEHEVSGAADDAVLVLDDEGTRTLLGFAGVSVWPAAWVGDVEAAAEAAARLGYPVAVTSAAPALRHRTDLGGVRLDVDDEDELRRTTAQVLDLTAQLGVDPGIQPVRIQPMAPRGTSVVIRTAEDPSYGPVLSFGLSGDAADLLGDLAYAIPPLTDVDVRELVRAPRASVRLFGHRGTPIADVAALEDLVARLSVLADDLPELHQLELVPVVVAEHGARVLGAQAALARADRADTARRLLPRT